LTLTLTLIDIQSRNLRFYAVNNSTFCGDTAKISITPNISKCSGPTLTYFTVVVGALVGMIFQVFLWQSPKVRCYGNQLNMGDVRKRHMGPPFLFASALDNGLADRKYAFKRFHGSTQATSCPNLVNFCPVISKFTLLKRAIFAAIRAQFDDDLYWRFETDWKIAIFISAE